MQKHRFRHARRWLFHRNDMFPVSFAEYRINLHPTLFSFQSSSSNTPVRDTSLPYIFIGLDPAGASVHTFHPSPPPTAQQDLRNLTGPFLLGAH